MSHRIADGYRVTRFEVSVPVRVPWYVRVAVAAFAVDVEVARTGHAAKRVRSRLLNNHVQREKALKRADQLLWSRKRGAMAMAWMAADAAEKAEQEKVGGDVKGEAA